MERVAYSARIGDQASSKKWATELLSTVVLLIF